MVKQPTVISLFAGGGGSSLGYKKAGYKELLAVDSNPLSCVTIKNNFNFQVLDKDIRTISTSEILETAKIKVGSLDVLDGSPPCQGFSPAGRRNADDNKNTLYLEYIRILTEAKPKAFVMENVPGMAQGTHRGVFNEIFQALQATGYTIRCKILNAANYQVPQYRKRIFFIGLRKNQVPQFPNPIAPCVTVGEAFKNVKNKTYYPNDEKNIPVYEQMQWSKGAIETVDTETLKTHIPRMVKNKNYMFNKIVVKLNPYKPSPTLCHLLINFGTGTLVHPYKNRLITIEEAKRLCTFPDDFKLTGTFQQQWGILGNAVMPMQMYHIAETLKKQL